MREKNIKQRKTLLVSSTGKDVLDKITNKSHTRLYQAKMHLHCKENWHEATDITGENIGKPYI